MSNDRYETPDDLEQARRDADNREAAIDDAPDEDDHRYENHS